MNNYTYVSEDKTGFELPGDDEKQIAAKKEFVFVPLSNWQIRYDLVSKKN